MEKHADIVRFFLLCGNIKNIVSSIQSTSECLQSHQIKENDTLKIVLLLCINHNIGYEREGVILLFKLFPDRSLTDLFDLMQKVFYRIHYLSYENIVIVLREIDAEEMKKETENTSFTFDKNAKKNVDPQKEKEKLISRKIQNEIPVISYKTVLSPVIRCAICTLIPPCSHKAATELFAESEFKRNSLPISTVNSICSEYYHHGFCSSYNTRGTCIYNHPKKLHIIEPLIIRCDICTLKWPCNNCPYSPYRNKILSTISSVQEKLSKIQKLNLPDLTLPVCCHLKNISSNWKEIMKQLSISYCTIEKKKILQDTILWCTTSYSCVDKKYINREKTIRNAFLEILESPLLELKLK